MLMIFVKKILMGYTLSAVRASAAPPAPLQNGYTFGRLMYSVGVQLVAIIKHLFCFRYEFRKIQFLAVFSPGRFNCLCFSHLGRFSPSIPFNIYPLFLCVYGGLLIPLLCVLVGRFRLFPFNICILVLCGLLVCLAIYAVAVPIPPGVVLCWCYSFAVVLLGGG